MTDIDFPYLSDDRSLVNAMRDCTPMVTLGYLERASHCVKLVELDGRLSGISQNGLCALEIEDAKTALGTAWWDLWPAEMQHVLRNAITRSRLGEVVRFDGECRTSTGQNRRWGVTVTPVCDRQGRIVRLLVVSREVGNAQAA